jgi:transcriptional regulator with XRE-family HTH domain
MHTTLDNMRVGPLLRSWRQKHDIGIRELAQEIGVSHGTVSRIERGEEINAATMMKLLNWMFGKSATNGQRKKRSGK